MLCERPGQITASLVGSSNTDSRDQKSTMCLMGLQSRHQQGYILSAGPRRNLFPCLFQLQGAACVPWLMAPSSIFKVRKNVFEWPSFHSDPLAFCVWGPFDCIQTTSILQQNLSISTSLTAAGMALLLRGSYSQVLGSGPEHLWRASLSWPQVNQISDTISSSFVH